jgi:hypothetical protein
LLVGDGDVVQRLYPSRGRPRDTRRRSARQAGAVLFESDWVAWHRAYDDPGSELSWRLERVRERIAVALDQAPAGAITVASLCAGDGRDLLGVLADHPRAGDVDAVLVEQNHELVDRARQRAAAAAGRVEVVAGDASWPETFLAVVPVQLLLLCGIFGNVDDDDIAGTIHVLPGFCRPGAIVIWTHQRRDPDIVPHVQRWFAAAGFVEEGLDGDPDRDACVGVHRYAGPPVAPPTEQRLFRFR